MAKRRPDRPAKDLPEIVVTPEMVEAGKRLMVAWDDEDDPLHLGSSYGNFVERLVREMLAHHSPAVSVRMRAVD